MHLRLLCALLLLGITACSTSPGGGVPDASSSSEDAGGSNTSDAGNTDAGLTDAGAADAGAVDAGASDAGTADAGDLDAGTVDAGSDAGTYTPSGPCDDGLAINDQDPANAARALDLCDFVTLASRLPGVVSARYVRADGSPFTSSVGVQAGLLGSFGPNVHVQQGHRILALSTGHARTAADPGACGSPSCSENSAGTAPPGWPSSATGCPVPSMIADDVALELQLVAPAQATGFSFTFNFYTFNVPEWVCTEYDDEFVALMNPPPMGALNGNIAVVQGQSVGSLTATSVCDPAGSSHWADHCTTTCPSLPMPFCPQGAAGLQGTGFDTWSTGAGATGWLRASAPVTGGETFTLRLAIWDGGDQTMDSTVLLDNFQWITDGTVVTVGGRP